mmetsp:Transcript_26448/g.33012  ORF Transcript_26448/g.33012 Transcript_26448/m.33012 type:complete len:135 (-) Transcript_26448:127-531(-)|eukprot:scaffold78506_cov31-Tisochrysis_lutea.AAC.1
MSQQMVQLELDEKDKESFEEMQTSMGQARQEIAMLDANLRKRTTEKREAELILSELSTMSSETAAYKQVGKMFLQTPIDDLKSFLGTKVERCTKDCETLTEKRSHATQAAEKLQEDFQQFIKEHIYQQQGAPAS